MNERLSISVIIPVYNGEYVLSDCLSSVCLQNDTIAEIIVVDNNSTDHTKSIIEKFQRQYPNIRYVFEQKRARGAARNKGIAHACGDILVMTDADCIVPADWIAQLIHPIVDEEEDVVMGFEHDGQHTYVSCNVVRSHERYLENHQKDKYISVFDSKNCAMRAFVARDVGFDDEMGNLEDYEFGLRLRERYRIRFMPNVRVTHMYKTSFIEWLCHSCDRAYWMAQIYKRYKENKKYEDVDFVEALRLKNMIMFPVWSFSLMIRKGFSRGVFVFLSELFWRFGLIRGLLARRSYQRG